MKPKPSVRERDNEELLRHMRREWSRAFRYGYTTAIECIEQGQTVRQMKRSGYFDKESYEIYAPSKRKKRKTK
jgi:hypothetical protein